MNRKVTCLLIASVVVNSAGCSKVQKGDPNSDVGLHRAEEIARMQEAWAPLPDSAFKASLSVENPPAVMITGQRERIEVSIKNLSNSIWPARGRSGDGFFQVNLGNIWLDDKNTPLTGVQYIRNSLPHDVKPGQEIVVSLTIIAPASPGTYTLEIDLVQEMVSWFGDKGVAPPQFKVNVRE